MPMRDFDAQTFYVRHDDRSNETHHASGYVPNLKSSCSI